MIREYFERRAAAQAVKARVESYERGGYDAGNAVALRQGNVSLFRILYGCLMRTMK